RLESGPNEHADVADPGAPNASTERAAVTNLRVDAVGADHEVRGRRRGACLVTHRDRAVRARPKNLGTESPLDSCGARERVQENSLKRRAAKHEDTGLRRWWRKQGTSRRIGNATA